MFDSQAPLTESLHQKWSSEICQVFQGFGVNSSNVFFILNKYLGKTPEKFYSNEVLKEYIRFLRNAKEENPQILATLLTKYSKEIGLGYKTLSNINKSDIHDVIASNTHDDVLNFIDKKIHFPILQILEKPYFIPLLLFEEFHRTVNDKGCDKIDLFNITEGYLKTSELSFVIKAYDSTVRNGIAHGNYYYTDIYIEYIAKKGKPVKKIPQDILNMFDDLIDYSNGFYLAIIIFLITEKEFCNKKSISIPFDILVEELKYRTKSPLWEVDNCLESEIYDIGKQINLYIKTDLVSKSGITSFCYYSALVVELLRMNKDRIFLNIKSPNGGGFAAFKGIFLRRFIESNYKDYNCLKESIEEDGVFFMPYSNSIFKYLSKIQIFKAIVEVQKQVFFNKNRDKYFEIKANELEFKQNGDGVIADAKVILNTSVLVDLEHYIKDNLDNIVQKTINDAKQRVSCFSMKKYFRVNYIRISFYISDFRLRDIRSEKHYFASVLYNKSKNIQSCDRVGEIEIMGDYRISWKLSGTDSNNT